MTEKSLVSFKDFFPSRGDRSSTNHIQCWKCGSIEVSILHGMLTCNICKFKTDVSFENCPHKREIRRYKKWRRYETRKRLKRKQTYTGK